MGEVAEEVHTNRSGPRSRRQRILRGTVIAVLIAAVAAIAFLWWASGWAIDPRTLHMPLDFYLMFDHRTLAYCMVPKDATETEIRARLGEPTEVLSSFAEWRDYRAMRRVTDWTVPDRRPPDDRIIVYIHASGVYQAEVYYAIDGSGSLSWAFIGENP